MSTEQKKKAKVSNTKALHDALAAGFEASQIEIDNTEALAAARAEGVEEGKKGAATTDLDAIRAEAAKAERARISEIHSLARAGFDAELKAAIDNGDSPEKFALALLKAAQDRGVTLDAIRKDAPKPAAHAAPSKPDATGAKPWADVHATAPQRM